MAENLLHPHLVVGSCVPSRCCRGCRRDPGMDVEPFLSPGERVDLGGCGADLVDSAGQALQHVSRGEHNGRRSQWHDATMHDLQT